MRGAGIAGSNFHPNPAGSQPAPVSIHVTPAGVNMIVGGTRQFTVLDEHGYPRTDAMWTVDNTSVGTIDTNTSPALAAVAVGQATLTATVGTITAQTQIHVLTASSLRNGTVLWSVPYPVGQIVQAEPTTGSPDLYSVAQGSGGISTRAFTPDSIGSARGTADGYGGILVQPLPLTGSARLIDVDGQTGAQLREYDSSPLVLGDSSSGIAYATDGSSDFAFDIASGSTTWTDNAPPTSDDLSLLAATAGGGVKVFDANYGDCASSPTYGKVSLDTTGRPSPCETFVTGLLGSFALGNWVGSINGSSAMFKAFANDLSLSAYIAPQGNREQQDGPKAVLSEFIPFPPCPNSNPACDTADKVGNHIEANVQPIAGVRHIIFTAIGTTLPHRVPATIANFRKEAATPRDAIALITHSEFPGEVPPGPPYDGVNYAIGLKFVDGSLVRTPDLTRDPSTNQLSQPFLAYTFPPDANPPVTFIPQINSNAKVVFIGACDTLHDVIPGLWNINSQTVGQALVVPDLNASKLDNAGLVDLWHATNVWEHIATALLAGQTIQQAVDAANKWLAGSNIVNRDHPAETWKIIGDTNVRLNP
jgi:hypothetical protein